MKLIFIFGLVTVSIVLTFAMQQMKFNEWYTCTPLLAASLLVDVKIMPMARLIFIARVYEESKMIR